MLTTTREGKESPAVCPKCKCRLNVFTWEDMTFAHHFYGDDGKDAYGHTCSDVGKVWPVRTKKVRSA